MPGAVAAIFIAPEAKAAPVSLPQIVVVPERGLEGDRYFFGRGSFSRWPGDGRHVTLIESEAIEWIRREAGIDLAAGLSRRNVETTGVDLAGLNGHNFRIGEVVLRGTRECAPCRHLEGLIGAELMQAMKGRGGLRANIVEGGVIRVGDVIEPL